MPDTQKTIVSEELNILLQDTHFSNRFEILEIVGYGGSAKVYKARDKNLDHIVALKIYRTDADISEGAQSDFLNRVRRSREIQHPSIVHILDYGRSGPIYYLTMSWIESQNLRQYIESMPTSIIQKLMMLQSLVSILRDLHNKGWVHRDLKPDNILIDSKDRLFLIDLDIAESKSQIPDKSELSGTPLYMSPEQRKGEATSAFTDIYSFGILALECLCEKSPVEIKKVIDQQSLPSWMRENRRSIPRDFAVPLLRCLNENLQERPSSAELETALQSALSQARSLSSKRRIRTWIVLLLITGIARIIAPVYQALTQVRVSSSSELSPGSAVHVLDQDPDTSWTSNPDDSRTQWLIFDFKRVYAFSMINIDWNRHFSEHITVSISKDQTAWKIISQQFVDRHGITFLYFPKIQSRYWKISFSGFHQPSRLSVSDVIFARDDNVQSSSIEKDTTRPEYISDGDSRTRWSSAFRDKEWIMIDLLKRRNFSWIHLEWEMAYAKSYVVEASDTGNDWNIIHSVTKSDGGPDLIWTGPQEARFLRLFCLERATTYGSSLWDLSIWNEPCVTASSMQSEKYRVEYAFDNDPYTRWSSRFKDRQWLTINFQKPVQFNQITILWERAYAKSYALQISDDGKTWKTLHQENNGRGGFEEIKIPAVKSQYLRLLCKKRGTPFGFSIFEFSVADKVMLE